MTYRTYRHNGRTRFIFAPVPACLAEIILETQARHGVTLARGFAK